MFSISYEKSTLSNGLQLVLHQDRSLPMVAVNLWYHVGSKDEEVGRTGFAHLFEHVMFEGSKNHNKLFFDPLQKVGANLNGSTTSDRTNYWETVPSNYLELALWLESDRMGFLLDALDQKRFDVQRDVVKNERRQSYENRPYGKSHLLLQPALYPSPHPYSWPVIGSQEDLDAAALDDIKAFFRTYYAPSNASLAIAGDFDLDEARGLVERYFGDIPPGPGINRVGRMDSPLKGEVRMTVRDKVQLPRLSLVWPTGPMFGEDEAPLDILATVLGDGKSSRLYRKLVYEMQIARNVSVSSYTQEIAGEFEVQATASPGHSLEEIQEVVEAELTAARSEPPGEHEIARARNRFESQHVRLLERFGGFGGRADQLNHYNVFARDPSVINTDLERYASVSGEDLLRVAVAALGGDRVRMAVLPEETVSASTSTVIDRSVMPGSSASPTYAPPVPKRATLPNGLSILHVRSPALPLVAIGLVLKRGATGDPVDRPGLAHMTASMLIEGTATRSSRDIADEMEFLGSHLGSDASREHVTVSAETLSPHWPKALEVMADVVKNATFPDRELKRVRNERLTDLKRLFDDPAAIAQRASRALVYGPDSAHGHPGIGTPQSVEAITRAELVAHFEGNYAPDAATLVVVGDVAEDELLARATEHLGDWAGEVQALGPAPDSGPRSAPTTLFLADKPGAAQSVIRAGHLTIPRHDPDYDTMRMLNYAFGGQATARLFMNLRQDKGYSYGYYSSIEWLAGPSALFAGGAVQTAVTKEAVVETLKEFADIRGDRPLTEDEFNASRDGMLRSVPSQFETQAQIAHQVSVIAMFDLPDDYYSGLVARTEAVTLGGLHNVAARRIDDKHLMALIVGDRQVVEPGLQELGLPVVLVDYEGRPL